jgi:imidazolonepropionase-like amidohydrolase
MNDPTRPIALIGATLIDGNGGTPVADSVVTVVGDRIEQVGTRQTVAIPTGATVVDVSGKFLLPGLIDVHVHYFEWMGDLFLAHGVTTVKDVGNDLEWIRSTRDEIEAGAANGPRIHFTGNGLDTPPPRRDHFIGIENADMARRTVRVLHEGGAMAIKIRETMQVDLLRPIVDEAHKCGIKVTGHLRSMGAAEAAEAGIDGLEHAAGIVQSTLDTWLKIDLDTLERADVYAKYVAERKSFSLIPRGRGEAVVKELANRGVALIPTMSGWWRMASDRREQFREEAARLAADPALAYVPEMARSIWSTSQLYDVPDPDDMAALRHGYDIVRHLLRFHTEQGGRVLGGSDTFVGVPGLSTQRELLFFVDTGYTPLEAISMTTLDNARFMDVADSLGSIEPGKLADMLVLGSDPLASIDNIADVAAVYRGGQPVDLEGPRHPRMPTARPEMIRPLWVERKLLAGGYEFEHPSFAEPHRHTVSGGCC